MNNLQGNIIVQKKSIPQKDILLKTIPAQNILTLNQIKQLKTKSTHFAPKFCKACFQKYSSPELFQECQNKNSVRVPIIGEPILEPNLQLFEKIPEKQFRLCKVETARFCQNCRQANLSKAELRLFNQLLDRTLKGKSVAIVNSQRTHRASNFEEKLMPRAIAVFPVVSENVIKLEPLDNELCHQLSKEAEKVKSTSYEHSQKISRSEQNKYRKYEKVEVSLRKIIFQDKALESLLFSRKQFIRCGVSFKARQYTDEHLAGLVKLGFKETQLEALQKSMELITGVKLTSN